MKTDLYAYAGAYSRVLDTLAHLLRKAKEHAAATGATEAEMFEWRLAPDQFNLRQQAISIIYFGQQWLARAADLPLPPALGPDAGLAEMKTGIAEAKTFIAALTPQQFEGRDDVAIKFDLGPRELTMTVGQWMNGFVTPNVYFHLSMAYAILRNRGIALSKQDWFAGGI